MTFEKHKGFELLTIASSSDNAVFCTAGPPAPVAACCRSRMKLSLSDALLSNQPRFSRMATTASILPRTNPAGSSAWARAHCRQYLVHRSHAEYKP